jgi:hypothetical protein
MVLTCPFCHAKVSSGSNDCPACKQRMTRRCPTCAEDISVKSAECKYCGEAVEPAREAVLPAPKPPVPDIVFMDDPAKSSRSFVGAVFLTSLKAFFLGAVGMIATWTVAASTMKPRTDGVVFSGPIAFLLITLVVMATSFFRLKERHGFSGVKAFVSSFLGGALATGAAFVALTVLISCAAR